MNERAGTLAAFGAFFTVSGLYQAWRGWSTSDWRAAQGEVTGIFMSETEEEDEDLESPRYGEKKLFFLPRVLYKYSVHGKEYEGCVIQEGLFRLPVRFLAERRIAEYRTGQRVTVYVSPRDPAKAVLVRGAPVSAFVMLATGVLLLAGAYAAR